MFSFLYYNVMNFYVTVVVVVLNMEGGDYPLKLLGLVNTFEY